MNLQNGYKVIYDSAVNNEHTLYASKTGVFADAEVICEAEIGKFKLIYEKGGRFYGSETGIPAEGDYCFVDFDKVFVKEEEVKEEEPVETPENGDEPTEQPAE